MSDLMREFLTMYLAWAELNKTAQRTAKPLDNGLNFSMELGLCSNICQFVEWKHRGRKYWSLRLLSMNELGRELKELLAKTTPSAAYPFGFRNYHAFYEDGTQHTDPNRLNWIKHVLRFETL